MGLLERLAMDRDEDLKKGKASPGTPGQKEEPKVDPYLDLKKKIFDRVVEEIKISSGDDDETNMQHVEEEIKNIINEVIESEAHYLTRNERAIVSRDIINETIGFGPSLRCFRTIRYPRSWSTDMIRSMWSGGESWSSAMLNSGITTM
jgi:hypothetical protein